MQLLPSMPVRLLERNYYVKFLWLVAARRGGPAERQVGVVAGGGVHGGAEGVEGGSDTVTWWRDTLCAAAKRLQGCARGIRYSKGY